LIEVEAEDVCVGSHRENRRIDIDGNEDNNEDNTKILLRVQGKDLRWFDKYKIGLHLKTTLYGKFPEMQCIYGAGEVTPSLV
jgi:hypothetical protein